MLRLAQQKPSEGTPKVIWVAWVMKGRIPAQTFVSSNTRARCSSSATCAHNMCVRVRARVCAKEFIKIYSKCAVQHSYHPATAVTLSSLFSPAVGATHCAKTFRIYSCRQHTTARALNTMHETTRHTLLACVPYRSPHPSPCIPTDTGGGGLTEKYLWYCRPPSSQISSCALC